MSRDKKKEIPTYYLRDQFTTDHLYKSDVNRSISVSSSPDNQPCIVTVNRQHSMDISEVSSNPPLAEPVQRRQPKVDPIITPKLERSSSSSVLPCLRGLAKQNKKLLACAKTESAYRKLSSKEESLDNGPTIFAGIPKDVSEFSWTEGDHHAWRDAFADEEEPTELSETYSSTGEEEPLHANGEATRILESLAKAERTDSDEKVEQSKVNEEKRRLKRRILCLGMALLFSIVAIAFLLVLLWSTRQRLQSAEDSDTLGATVEAWNNQPTPMATQIPSTTAPSYDFLDQFRRSLPNTTLQRLNEPDSAQGMAFNWLANHQSFTRLQQWRKMQLFALATIYHSLEGPQWPELAANNWLDDRTSECNWTLSTEHQYNNNNGESPPPAILKCNEDGRLQSLELFNIDLSRLNPSIPPEIGFLSFLGTLDMHNNSIHAQLSRFFPEEIANLSNLEHIDLSSNSFHGTLPSTIGLFSNLKSIEITGSTSRETIVGQLQSELGRMKLLTNLGLQNTLLSGSIPTEIGLMASLKRGFEFQDNNLSGSLPSELGMLTNLISCFSLSNNAITGTIPSELGMLTALQCLSLPGNNITGSIPTELGNLDGAASFDLHSNKLSGTIPTQLGSMHAVGSFVPLVLDLSDNSLSGTIPKAFLMQKVTWIDTLNLANNRLNGTIPSPGQRATTSAIAHLYLGNNSLTGQIPSQLGAIFRLKILDLSNLRLDGTIPVELSEPVGRERIQWLDVRGNMNLTGSIPDALCSLNLNCPAKSQAAFSKAANPCFFGFDCTADLCGCNCTCPAL